MYSTTVPRPRLCFLRRQEQGKDYGFNLFKRKNDDGQYIGNIEDGSAAVKAGLKEDDRLIEVNGENVENKSHNKVVKKIR